MGLTGAGVGVAVIDSGISTFHDDLTVVNSSTLYPYGNQRVTKFVDFVNGQALPYDDNGHGTHVAGIIGGNGNDSAGSASKAGMAPRASIVALKVLDVDGAGTIADIIEALNWVLVNKAAYNIRVVNLSVGAPVRESYWTDPLTLAAKKLTDQGIVVVVAAGNLGTRTCSAGPHAIRRDHGARQRALGADGRRVEHARHADTQRRHRSRTTARVVRPSSTGARNPTWSRPAPARSRSRCPAARSTRPSRWRSSAGCFPGGRSRTSR